MEIQVRKKAVVLTALSLLTLGSVAVLPHVVQAADGTTTKDLVIHKIKSDDAPIHENDGDKKPDSLTGDYLPGAGFTVVDVSDNYYAYVVTQAGRTPQAIYNDYFTLLKHESNAQIIARGSIVGTEKVDAATGEYPNADGTADGKVTFADLPTKTSGGKDAIYAVIETTRPKNTVTTNGASEVASNVIGTIPTVVAMPLNGTTPTINIYPKNEVGKLTKEFANPTADQNISVSQHISYDISLKLPRDLGERIAATGNLKYKSFTVNEIPGLGLKFAGYGLGATMVDDGTTKQSLGDFLTQYHLTAVADPVISFPNGFTGDGTSKASLTISPATPAADITGWEALAGKTLKMTVICYIDMDYFLTHPDKVDADIVNKANYKVTEDNGFEVVPGEDQVKSITAKYKFQKNDANTGHLLTGAKFAVSESGAPGYMYFREVGGQGSGVYMLITGSVGDYQPGTDSHELTVGADGTLTLLGLDEDKDYELTELQAPDGYRSLTNPIEFHPNRTDDFDQTGELNLQNNDNDGFHNIYNTPENLLPSTGGRGFAIFSIVAVAGLGGAGVLYYLKRKNAQEVA